MNNVKIQTAKDALWFDEAGASIPYQRISKLERSMEKSAAKFHKQALNLNKGLEDFKREVYEMCEELHTNYMKSKGVSKESKGNWTWYNFDRSIKIEVSVNEQIAFDDLAIEAAKSKLSEFLSSEITSENEVIKQMVLSAFETRSGRLDTKKVMSLLKYKERVKSPVFLAALDLIESAIRRPQSKTYFRVSQRMEDGSYEVIDLNFSSVSF